MSDNDKGPKIMPCKCEHEFQDARYGRGMRVHNKGRKERGEAWTCTVCGKRKET